MMPPLRDIPKKLFLQNVSQKRGNVSHLNQKVQKRIFKTGYEIIEKGNVIIYPVSRPLIKKTLLLQNVSHFYQGIQN